MSNDTDENLAGMAHSEAKKLSNNVPLSEQMLSDSVMSEYQDMVNQQAQAAAAVMILGQQPAKRRKGEEADVSAHLLANQIVTSRPANDPMSKWTTHPPATSNTQMTSQIAHLLKLTSEGGTVLQTPAKLVTAGGPPIADNSMTHVAPATSQGSNVTCQSNSGRKAPMRRLSAADREERFKCNQCPYRSKWSHGLSNHMRTHNNTVFKCEHCDYSTPWKGDLTNHIRVHTGNMFTCDQCDFQTYRKQGLDKHMVMHTGAKPFKCPECNYSCSQPGNLKKHMMRHTGEKPISCDLCQYKCRQTTQLRQHVQLHHSNGQATGRVLTSTSVLATAASSTSVSSGRPTGSMRGLARVAMSRNRKYTCILCRMSWMSRQSYSKHMFSKHGSTSPYRCGFVCSKTFSTATECDKHKSTHDSPKKPLTSDASTCTSLDEMGGSCGLDLSKPRTEQFTDLSQSTHRLNPLSSHFSEQAPTSHQPITGHSEMDFPEADQSSYSHPSTADHHSISQSHEFNYPQQSKTVSDHDNQLFEQTASAVSQSERFAAEHSHQGIMVDDTGVRQSGSHMNQSLPSISVDNQPLPGISMKDQSLPAISLGNQSLPGISLGNQSLPAISLGNQSLPGISVGNQPLPGISVGNQSLPGVSVDSQSQPNILEVIGSIDDSVPQVSAGSTYS